MRRYGEQFRRTPRRRRTRRSHARPGRHTLVRHHRPWPTVLRRVRATIRPPCAGSPETRRPLTEVSSVSASVRFGIACAFHKKKRRAGRPTPSNRSGLRGGKDQTLFIPTAPLEAASPQALAASSLPARRGWRGSRRGPLRSSEDCLPGWRRIGDIALERGDAVMPSGDSNPRSLVRGLRLQTTPRESTL